MSGIAGLIQFANHRQDLPALLKTMTDSLAHRGPAGESFYQSHQNMLALGQRHFDIPDNTSKEASTFQTNHGNLVLLFDGDIYNALEIKILLEKDGVLVKTGTASELILLSYQHWGVDCLQKFNGAWSILIFDKLKNQIFASRDRVGVKPFYYFKNEQFFVFASEVKAILKLPFIERKMNRGAVFDLFFQNKYEIKENFFQNIHELQPAHFLLLDLKSGDLTIKRYYDLSFNSELEDFSEKKFDRHTQKIKQLIEFAVKRQVSNINPASLLSGGIDSSVLTCLSTTIAGKAPKVFTSCFDNELFDEQKWASIVVEHTQAQWFKTFPKLPELLTDLETLAYCQDTPLTSAGTYSQFRSMQLAKEQGIKIIFDGQGADAMFAGQLPHQASLWRSYLSKLKFADLKREMNAFGPFLKSSPFLFKMLLKNAYYPRLGGIFKHSLQKKYFRELGYFNEDFLRENHHRYDLYQNDQMPSLNHQLHHEYFGGGLKYLLKCVDRSSMWHSVRARTPYADDLPLMEYVFDIPANFKIRQATSKVLLREAFRGSVPQLILDRKDKKALASPNNQWIMDMRENILPYFEALDGSVFNKKLLLKDFNQFFKLDSPLENYRLFKYIGFAVWRKVFQV